MIKIIWYGTATILLQVDEEKLLFDPFFRFNKKLETLPADIFNNANYIFNTNSHLDHTCHLPLILKNSNAKLFAPK